MVSVGLKKVTFTAEGRETLSRVSEMRRQRRIGEGFPLDSHYLKGFLRAEGVGG